MFYYQHIQHPPENNTAYAAVEVAINKHRHFENERYYELSDEPIKRLRIGVLAEAGVEAHEVCGCHAFVEEGAGVVEVVYADETTKE